MRLTDTFGTGPERKFRDAHIFYVLHLLDREGVMGRSTLAKTMGLGEGSVRSIIEILRRWDVVDIRQAGISLNENGRAFLRDISMRMVDVPETGYVPGSFQQGLVVTGAADRVTDGMHQRDRGIIAGATGASVFVMKDDSLIMPTDWNMDYRDPDFSREVRKVGMCDGDVLVISGASERDTAAVSAIAIGLDLL